MAALLVGLSVLCVMLSVALPVWETAMRREREAELVFRGEQYARAIVLFQRKYAGTLPPTIDVLLQQRFLRRRYRDPMTNDDFQVLYATLPTGGTGLGYAPAPDVSDTRRGIVGIASRSTEASLRRYNGRGRYNEWVFIAPEGGTRTALPPGSPPSRQDRR